ncbi:MAG: YdbH domain-containing protein [Marinobacter sp.]|uniref:YdbH domain-containing protein n=2 Tax=Marinobacter sp. TaxID=50741 RepID=UPI003299C0F6
MPLPADAFDWSFVLEQGTVGLDLPDTRSGDWQMTGVRADLAGISLAVNFSGTGSLAERSSVAGHVSIRVAELQHPLLKPQGWQFEGRANGTLADLSLEGQVRADSGLVADVVIRNVTGEFRAGRATLRLSGENIQTVMAATLADWPELLEVSSGEVRAVATMRIEPDAPLALESRFEFERVNGLVSTSAVTDMNGQLRISLEGNTLTASTSELTIAKINTGIGIGPLRFLADYRAPLGELFEGVLNIQQANAEFLGGRLRVAPRSIDLSSDPWQLPIDAYDVSLAKLLQLYPTEGLSGTGHLTGHIPVSIGSAGVEVAEGRMAAEPPGGIIRLPAERLKAILGSSQGMEPVVEALQNFHYKKLNSTIDYDTKGRLLLHLRLEGQKASDRREQPIVLNLNLEEDIPALLTSLQLSGRVNEAVTERVRERVKQTEQEAEP